MTFSYFYQSFNKILSKIAEEKTTPALINIFLKNLGLALSNQLSPNKQRFVKISAQALFFMLPLFLCVNAFDASHNIRVI